MLAFLQHFDNHGQYTQGGPKIGIEYIVIIIVYLLLAHLVFCVRE